MDRRHALQLLSLAAASCLPDSVWAQAGVPYSVFGSGPTVVTLGPVLQTFVDALSDKYRVVVLNYPLANSPIALSTAFTADGVCRDIFAVADSVGANRFAWYGFSFSSVVGLQLAARSDRLSALVIGGWPPLEAQYAETLAVAEIGAAGGAPVGPMTTFYRSLQGWDERAAVANLQCPRMAFAGTMDQFAAQGYTITIAALIAKHREELERQGWVIRAVEGFGHELGGRPDVVMPLVRAFLDPVLLAK